MKNPKYRDQPRSIPFTSSETGRQGHGALQSGLNPGGDSEEKEAERRGKKRKKERKEGEEKRREADKERDGEEGHEITAVAGPFVTPRTSLAKGRPGSECIPRRPRAASLQFGPGRTQVTACTPR